MIRERNEAFGVRVYRGQERGYEWVGTFKFRDYGGRRGARKAAEQAEAEARFRGNATRRRTLTIEAYVERYLDDYRERQKDSAYVTAGSRLAPFRREFGHLQLEDGAVDRRAASDWAREHRSCVAAVVAMFNRAIADDELTRNPFLSTQVAWFRVADSTHLVEISESPAIVRTAPAGRDSSDLASISSPSPPRLRLSRSRRS
jgi:hypothetical protein